MIGLDRIGGRGGAGLGYLRLLRLEARRGIGVWLFFASLALAWAYYSRADLYFRALLWTEASVAARNMIFFAGPAVAGAAAWMAGREDRRRLQDLLATMPQPAWSRQIATWLGIMLWGVTAYLLVALALVASTARHATWGRPIFWPPLVGLLALLAHGALGFAAGRCAPGRFTAPLVAVFLFFVQAFVGDGGFGNARLPGESRFGWLPFLSPVASLGQSVWYGVQPDVAVPQALFFIGLTSLALNVLALRERRSLGTWGGFALVALVVVAGIVTMQRAVPGNERERAGALLADPGLVIPYTPVCVAGALPVCAHPAYRPWLEENAALVNRLAAPLLGLPGAPTRAEQNSPLVRERTSQILMLNPQPRQEAVAPDVARSLVQDTSSMANRQERCPDTARPYSCMWAQGAIARWLLLRAGESVDSPYTTDLPQVVAAAERFVALPVEQQRAWLATNLVPLREGRLRLEDLP